MLFCKIDGCNKAVLAGEVFLPDGSKFIIEKFSSEFRKEKLCKEFGLPLQFQSFIEASKSQMSINSTESQMIVGSTSSFCSKDQLSTSIELKPQISQYNIDPNPTEQLQNRRSKSPQDIICISDEVHTETYSDHKPQYFSQDDYNLITLVQTIPAASSHRTKQALIAREMKRHKPSLHPASKAYNPSTHPSLG